jgi:hypothetical protein
MSIIAKIKAVETEIANYVAASGKDIEEVYDEVKDFLTKKTVAAQNAQAASSEPGPKAA